MNNNDNDNTSETAENRLHRLKILLKNPNNTEQERLYYQEQIDRIIRNNDDLELSLNVDREKFKKFQRRISGERERIYEHTKSEYILRSSLKDTLVFMGFNKNDIIDVEEPRTYVYEGKIYELTPDKFVSNKAGVLGFPKEFYLEEYYGIDLNKLESKKNKYTLIEREGFKMYYFAPFCQKAEFETEIELYNHWTFMVSARSTEFTKIKTYPWNILESTEKYQKITYIHCPSDNTKKRNIDLSITETEEDIWKNIVQHERDHCNHYNMLLGLVHEKERNSELRFILDKERKNLEHSCEKNRDFSVLNFGDMLRLPKSLEGWEILKMKKGDMTFDVEEMIRFVNDPDYQRKLDMLKDLRSAYRFSLAQAKKKKSEAVKQNLNYDWREEEKRIRRHFRESIGLADRKWDITPEGTFRYPKTGPLFLNNGVREVEEIMRERACGIIDANRIRKEIRLEKKSEPRYTSSVTESYVFHNLEQTTDKININYTQYLNITEDSELLKDMEEKCKKEILPHIKWLQKSNLSFQASYDAKIAELIDIHWSQGKTTTDLNMSKSFEDIIISDGFKSIKGDFTKPYCIIGHRKFNNEIDMIHFQKYNDFQAIWKQGASIVFVTNWRRAPPSQIGRMRYCEVTLLNILARNVLIWKSDKRLYRSICAEYLTYRVSNFELSKFLDSCLKAGQTLMGKYSRVSEVIDEMLNIPQKHKIGNYWKDEYRETFKEIISLAEQDGIFGKVDIIYRGGTVYNEKSILEDINRVKLGDKDITATYHHKINNWKTVKTNELKRMNSEEEGITGGKTKSSKLLNVLRDEEKDFKIFFSHNLTYHAMNAHLDRLESDNINLEKVFKEHGEKIGARGIWTFGNNKASMDTNFEKCKLSVAIARLMENPQYSHLVTINDIVNTYNKIIEEDKFDRTAYQLYWYWADKHQIGTFREFYIENVIGRLFSYYQDNFFRAAAEVDEKNQILDSRKDADIIRKTSRIKNEQKLRNQQVTKRYKDANLPVPEDALWKRSQITEDESKWSPSAENEEYFGMHLAMFHRKCITKDQYNSLQDGVIIRLEKRLIVPDIITTCPKRDHVIKSIGISEHTKTRSLNMTNCLRKDWDQSLIDMYSESRLDRIYDVVDDSFRMRITWGNGMRQISSSTRHVAIQDWIEKMLRLTKDDVQTAHHSDDKWTEILYRSEEELKRYLRLSYITKRLYGIKMNLKKTFVSNNFGEYLSFYLINGKIFYPNTKKILANVPDFQYKSYEYDYVSKHMSVITLIENGATPQTMWIYRAAVNMGLEKKWLFQRKGIISPYGGVSRANAYMLAAGGAYMLLNDCINGPNWYEICESMKLFQERSYQDNIVVNLGELNYFQINIVLSRSFFGLFEQMGKIRKKLKVDDWKIKKAEDFIKNDPSLLFRKPATVEEGLQIFHFNMSRPDYVYGMDIWSSKYARSRYLIYQKAATFALNNDHFMTYEDVINTMKSGERKYTEIDRFQLLDNMCIFSTRFNRAYRITKLGGIVERMPSMTSKMYTYRFDRTYKDLLNQELKTELISHMLQNFYWLSRDDLTPDYVTVRRDLEEYANFLERDNKPYEFVRYIISSSELRNAIKSGRLGYYRFLDSILGLDKTAINYAIFPKTKIIQSQMKNPGKDKIDFVDFLDNFLKEICQKGSANEFTPLFKFYNKFEGRNSVNSSEGWLRESEVICKLACLAYFNSKNNINLFNVEEIMRHAKNGRNSIMSVALTKFIFGSDESGLRKFFGKEMTWYDEMYIGDEKFMGYAFRYADGVGTIAIAKRNEMSTYEIYISPILTISAKDIALKQLERMKSVLVSSSFSYDIHGFEYVETFRELNDKRIIWGKHGKAIRSNYVHSITLIGSFLMEDLTVYENRIIFGGGNNKRSFSNHIWWSENNEMQRLFGFVDISDITTVKDSYDNSHPLITFNFARKTEVDYLRILFHPQCLFAMKRAAPGEKDIVKNDLTLLWSENLMFNLSTNERFWFDMLQNSNFENDPIIMSDIRNHRYNKISKEEQDQIDKILFKAKISKKAPKPNLSGYIRIPFKRDISDFITKGQREYNDRGMPSIQVVKPEVKTYEDSLESDIDVTDLNQDNDYWDTFDNLDDNE